MSNGYARGQLAKAFLTAAGHESADVRRRADRRAADWALTLQALADGTTTLGSRTPVRGLPAWVTLNVLRGGFATGRATADVPFQADEASWAAELGVPAHRDLLFAGFLTDPGVALLNELLDGGGYRVDIPEDAALLSMAWLLRAGDREAALEIVDALAPFVKKLRLAPKRSAVAAIPSDHVHRMSAGEAVAALERRRPNARVEAQRETLSVWNPFFDRLVTLWLEKVQDGVVATDFDGEWRAKAQSFVAEYRRLASVHTLSSKHRRPKENGAVLLNGLTTIAIGGTLTPPQLGRIRNALAGSISKRGEPSSAQHVALRQTQARVAAAPPYWRLAGVAADRLGQVDLSLGLPEPSRYAGPVTDAESASSGLPAGSALPPVVNRVLARAHSAPIEDLLAEGVVPSAEVLAELTPALSASVVASSYGDESLARLAAANYRAFRRRRSLLLTKLATQVQLSELPWVRATSKHRTLVSSEALAVAHRVGSLALDHFPATITPNPLVQELSHLLREGHDPAVLVEELAADIFQGRFSDKFRQAAQTTARLLEGTLYARYYAIDTVQILSLAEPARKERSGWIWRRSAPTDRNFTFGDLCWARAGLPTNSGWSVARNGMVIEQAQILTTHNLAALVSAGVRPTRHWVDLARECFAHTADLLRLASTQPRPLANVRDAAYAWRQGIFFLSLPPGETGSLVDQLAAELGGPDVMTHLFAGLKRAAKGETGSQDTMFVGWTTQRHWILDRLP